MAPASPAPDHEQIREAVTDCYSSLARAAHAGQQITDCDPDPSQPDASAPPGTPAPASSLTVRCAPSAAETPSPSPS